MGRVAKRVPMDLDWPLGEVWGGYLLPDELHEDDCADCGNGYSPEAQHLFDQWYGNAPFDPGDTGSTPLTADTPEVWAFAARNVERSPEFYRTGEWAIRREAQRLANLWNAAWSHHLEQADVDALIAEGRLMDFTHTWSKETRWQPRDPAPVVTAAEVNRWSLAGMGHDSLNASVAVRAKCVRLGYPEVCATCAGRGAREKYDGQRVEAEAWEPTEPPTGDGWQMWETTSEGSPTSPVFATPQELAAWCSAGTTVFGSQKADAAHWLQIITGEDFAHVQIAPGVIVM